MENKLTIDADRVYGNHWFCIINDNISTSIYETQFHNINNNMNTNADTRTCTDTNIDTLAII